jgi:hypothetical protein
MHDQTQGSVNVTVQLRGVRDELAWNDEDVNLVQEIWEV